MKIGYSWRQSTVTDGGCKGNVSCTSYSRTFTIHKYGYGTAYTFTHNMNMFEHIAINGTNTTMHTDMYNAQFWARRAPPVDAQCSHRTLGSRSRFVCHPCHPCMRTCVWSLECPLPCVPVFLLPLPVPLPSSTWCPPQRPMRCPCRTPCATPAWGAWSLPTTSHPSQLKGEPQKLFFLSDTLVAAQTFSVHELLVTRLALQWWEESRAIRDNILGIFAWASWSSRWRARSIRTVTALTWHLSFRCHPKKKKVTLKPSVCVLRPCRKPVWTDDMQTSTASALAAFWLLREFHFISCPTMPIIGSSEGWTAPWRRLAATSCKLWPPLKKHFVVCPSQLGGKSCYLNQPIQTSPFRWKISVRNGWVWHFVNVYVLVLVHLFASRWLWWTQHAEPYVGTFLSCASWRIYGVAFWWSCFGESRTLLSLCTRFTMRQSRTPLQSISEARFRGRIARCENLCRIWVRTIIHRVSVVSLWESNFGTCFSCLWMDKYLWERFLIFLSRDDLLNPRETSQFHAACEWYGLGLRFCRHWSMLSDDRPDILSEDLQGYVWSSDENVWAFWLAVSWLGQLRWSAQGYGMAVTVLMAVKNEYLTF